MSQEMEISLTPQDEKDKSRWARKKERVLKLFEIKGESFQQGFKMGFIVGSAFGGVLGIVTAI